MFGGTVRRLLPPLTRSPSLPEGGLRRLARVPLSIRPHPSAKAATFPPEGRQLYAIPLLCRERFNYGKANVVRSNIKEHILSLMNHRRLPSLGREGVTPVTDESEKVRGWAWGYNVLARVPRSRLPSNPLERQQAGFRHPSKEYLPAS